MYSVTQDCGSSGNRLKVLISAYACEPGKGSEPEIGWQWSLQMARFHNVTVLTRSNNREAIEAALPPTASLGGTLRFVYHDLPPLALWLKKSLFFPIWYYLAWQSSAKAVVRELVALEHYDLLHHVTYGAVRYPTAFDAHEIPILWGPVGGMEDAPWKMLTPRFLVPMIGETVRNISNRLQTSRWSRLKRQAKKCSGIISSTREMQERLSSLGIVSALLPAIGISAKHQLLDRSAKKNTGPLRLLYAGRLLFWKGIDLALYALAQSRTDATLTLFGDGPFMDAAKRLADRLGIASRVEFRGKQTRKIVLGEYCQFDAMLHPSLHDSGAFVVLEAMIHTLPVICLDRGGPALTVKPGCGWKIAPHRRDQTIRDLAEAIRSADCDRINLREMGSAARQSVVKYYDWDTQGDAMNAIYQQTVAAFQTRRHAT